MRAFANALRTPDLRAQPRELVNRAAKVLDGGFTLDAVIRDISPDGARLAFGPRIPSGDTLLVIDTTLGVAHAARVIWRKGAEHGVRFLKTQDLRGLVSGQFDAARQVWLHCSVYDGDGGRISR